MEISICSMPIPSPPKKNVKPTYLKKTKKLICMKMLFELFHYLFFPSGDHFFKDIDGWLWLGAGLQGQNETV